MEFSYNNKVLVIDDKHEEALPVIEALARKGIFTIYWNGLVETKPENPLDGIRVVFLDMRFSPVTDSRSIITYLFTLLRYAISSENGPYVLFIWSKHDNEYLEEFKNEFSRAVNIPKPYLIINMEKSKFIKWTNEQNEVYAEIATTLDEKDKQAIRDEILEVLKCNNIDETIEKIQMQENVVENLMCTIDMKIKEINSLAILLMWENLVNTSAKNLVNNISTFSELTGDWDSNIKTLIQNLAVANAGKSLGTTAKECIVNALMAFNQMLPDELWNQLMKNNINEETFNFINDPSIVKTVDNNRYSISKTSKKYIIKKDKSDYTSFRSICELKEDVDKELCREIYSQHLKFLGKSNFKLLCERTASDDIKKPGRVYEVEDTELLHELCNSILKKQDLVEFTNIQLINLDVSSSCDYAQNKLKRIRILPGIMVEEEYFSFIDDTEDIYCTPELEISNKLVKIVFNFHYITNESKEKLARLNAAFSFRELLLAEIKHKLSSYISRVGIINL